MMNGKVCSLISSARASCARNPLLVGLSFFANTLVDASLLLACGNMHTDPKTGSLVAQPAPVNVILLICLVFEGLLFAIFTCIMFGVQMQAIWNDETGIEQLKKESSKRWNRRQRWRSMRAVFGLKGFSLTWLSPFTRSEAVTYAESNYTV